MKFLVAFSWAFSLAELSFGEPSDVWIRSNNSTIASSDEAIVHGYSRVGGCVDLIIPSDYMGLPVTRIENAAFSGARNLSSITLPKGIISISSRSFADCSSLERIVIPDNVTSIGVSAFQNCSRLKVIALPFSLDVINGSVFNGSGLENIRWPETPTFIGDAAFYGCFNLTKIQIPASIESIGSQAFRRCRRLEYIFFDGDAPAIGSDAFTETDLLNSIFVLAEHAESYGGEGAIWYGLEVRLFDSAPQTYSDALQQVNLTGVDSASGADPESRGIRNGVAYALGIPLTGNLSGDSLSKLPQFVKEIQDGQYQMSFIRPFEAPSDIVYCVEASESLDSESREELSRKVGNGLWNGTVIPMEESAGSGNMRTTVEFPSSVDVAKKRFMRLRVEIEN